MNLDQLNQIGSYDELINQLKEDQTPSQREEGMISGRNYVESMLDGVKDDKTTERVKKLTQKSAD